MEEMFKPAGERESHYGSSCQRTPGQSPLAGKGTDKGRAEEEQVQARQERPWSQMGSQDSLAIE